MGIHGYTIVWGYLLDWSDIVEYIKSSKEYLNRKQCVERIPCCECKECEEGEDCPNEKRVVGCNSDICCCESEDGLVEWYYHHVVGSKLSDDVEFVDVGGAVENQCVIGKIILSTGDNYWKDPPIRRLMLVQPKLPAQAMFDSGNKVLMNFIFKDDKCPGQYIIQHS